MLCCRRALTVFSQAYSVHNLNRCIARHDFFLHPYLKKPGPRLALVQDAVDAAASHFAGNNPLIRFHLKKKPAYRVAHLHWDLVFRKLNRNLGELLDHNVIDRAACIQELSNLLREGTPYRVYRTDIRSFYESIDQISLQQEIVNHQILNPKSINLLSCFFDHYASMGGLGVPRGLAISAVLAEIYMANFDRQVSGADHVFYFARYVDDIILITSGEESKKYIGQLIHDALPQGLAINYRKSSSSNPISSVSPTKLLRQQIPLLQFEYLGYQFSVLEPEKIVNQQKGKHFRNVRIDISNAKVRRMKTRICRSLMDFYRTGDFSLLENRIKFLANNFSIHDFKTRDRKLAGIYYSYPMVSAKSKSLKGLDQFLHYAVLQSTARFSKGAVHQLTQTQKRSLLANSFTAGFYRRTFLHFHPMTIHNIQSCWRNE